MIFIFVKYFEKRSKKVVYDSAIYLFMGKKITEEWEEHMDRMYSCILCMSLSVDIHQWRCLFPENSYYLHCLTEKLHLGIIWAYSNATKIIMAAVTLHCVILLITGEVTFICCSIIESNFLLRYINDSWTSSLFFFFSILFNTSVLKTFLSVLGHFYIHLFPSCC